MSLYDVECDFDEVTRLFQIYISALSYLYHLARKGKLKLKLFCYTNDIHR